jgi:hypothetical protein
MLNIRVMVFSTTFNNISSNVQVSQTTFGDLLFLLRFLLLLSHVLLLLLHNGFI